MNKKSMSIFICALVFCAKIFCTSFVIAPPKPLTGVEEKMSVVQAAKECHFQAITHALSKDVTPKDVDIALKEARKTLAKRKKELAQAEKPPKRVQKNGAIILVGGTPLAVLAGMQRRVYECEGVIKYLEHYKKLHKFVVNLDIEKLNSFLSTSIDNKIIESAIQKARSMESDLKAQSRKFLTKIKLTPEKMEQRKKNFAKIKEKLKKLSDIVALLQKKKTKTKLPVIYYESQPMGSVQQPLAVPLA